MKWGNDNEVNARDAYLNCMAAQGNSIRYKESGLHLHPAATYLGASSDGLLFDDSLDTCTMGCLEVKCPFSINGTSVVNLTTT